MTELTQVQEHRALVLAMARTMLVGDSDRRVDSDDLVEVADWILHEEEQTEVRTGDGRTIHPYTINIPTMRLAPASTTYHFDAPSSFREVPFDSEGPNDAGPAAMPQPQQEEWDD